MYGSKVNEKYIPDFLRKKFNSNIDYLEKKRIDKAEREKGDAGLEQAKKEFFAKKMGEYLENLVGAYDDFVKEHKGLSDEEIIDGLKNDIEFNMKDFMALERHFRNVKIAKDVEKFEGLSRTRDSMPEEAEFTKKEYYNLISDLEKALNNDDIVNYFNKYSELINAALDEKDDLFFNRSEGYWKKYKLDPNVNLSSKMKELYNDRFDENMDHNFGKGYEKLKNDIAKARSAYNNARVDGNETEMTKIQSTLEKYAKSVLNVLIDRLIGVGILERGFNNEKTALDPEKGAEKYEEIKKKKIQNKFSPWSPNYKNFYTDVTVKEMYDEIGAVLKRLSQDQMLEKHLQIPVTQNIPDKKYTDEEMKQLYATLKSGGPNKLYELLATPKFSAYRRKA